MKLYASWTHGNALAIENPENISRTTRFGWGPDISVLPGRSSWFHIAVPTPVIVGDVRAQLQKVFVMFEAQGGRIHDVHVYDGPNRIQVFSGLSSDGVHTTSLDGINTFVLPTPHTVLWGIGISFRFTAFVGIDSPIPPSKLVVVSAGGDFFV